MLDVSGSMNWSLVVRDNPYDDPGKTPDLPRAGEMSRLAAAKQDLLKALAHARVARYLTGRHSRQLEDGSWYHPPTDDVLEEAGLETVDTYIKRRRDTVRRFVL